MCCALLAVLFAIPLSLHRMFRPRLAAQDALAWRLHGAASSGNHVVAGSQRFSLRARAKSFGFAWAGLRHMVEREHNARIHLGCTLAVIGVSLALGLSREDWRWIVAAIVLVWTAEALNTAIENLCDLVSPGRNERVRIVKDVAAGAVLISAIAAAAIGVLTLWPYLAAIDLPLHLFEARIGDCWRPL